MFQFDFFQIEIFSGLFICFGTKHLNKTREIKTHKFLLNSIFNRAVTF